jgi:uncharacterized protein DUF5647
MTTEKIIQKNFQLSAAFQRYVVRHPEVLESIPKNAQIVLGDSKNHELTENNAKMAHKEKGKFYQAIRQQRGWKVLPIR